MRYDENKSKAQGKLKITAFHKTKREGVKDLAIILKRNKRNLNIRELRNNLADVIDRVTLQYDVITAEDNFKEGRKASIISNEMLKELMDCYKFTSEVQWDDETSQYFAKIKEIDVDGVGDTESEAVRMAVDNAEMAADNFFELTEMYMKISKFRKLYPYFLKVRLISNDEWNDQLKALGFE